MKVIFLLNRLHTPSQLATISTPQIQQWSYFIHCMYRPTLLLYPLHIQTHVTTLSTAYTDPRYYFIHCTYRPTLLLYSLQIKIHAFTESSTPTEPGCNCNHSKHTQTHDIIISTACSQSYPLHMENQVVLYHHIQYCVVTVFTAPSKSRFHCSCT